MKSLDFEPVNKAAFRPGIARLAALAVTTTDSPPVGGRASLIRQRFAADNWSRLPTGAPAFDDTAINFHRTVSRHLTVGTRTILFGEAQTTQLSSAPAVLVYGDCVYRRVGGAPVAVVAS